MHGKKEKRGTRFWPKSNHEKPVVRDMREKKRDKIDDASEISFWWILTETAGLALRLEQAEDVVNADWCGGNRC
jgi:hypothetical protein